MRELLFHLLFIASLQVSDSGLDTDNCYFWDSSPGELKDGVSKDNE